MHARRLCLPKTARWDVEWTTEVRRGQGYKPGRESAVVCRPRKTPYHRCKKVTRQN